MQEGRGEGWRQEERGRGLEAGREGRGLEAGRRVQAGGEAVHFTEKPHHRKDRQGVALNLKLMSLLHIKNKALLTIALVLYVLF